MKKRFIAVDISTHQFLVQGKIFFYFEKIKDINIENTCNTRTELQHLIVDAEKEGILKGRTLSILEIYIDTSDTD